jgi:hypothetical protein
MFKSQTDRIEGGVHIVEMLAGARFRTPREF